MNWLSWRRLRALCWKETLQIFRDPSSILIAFFMPILMLFIFGYGINLDSSRLRIGLRVEDMGKDAVSFANALTGSPWLEVHPYESRAELESAIVNSQIRGFVVIPQDFSKKLAHPGTTAPLQLIADGSEPNIAQFVRSTVSGVWQTWMFQRYEDRGQEMKLEITFEPRYWFNPAAQSRNFIIPGSITVVMTVIGALLTSLVVAREWERGTMEAVLSTPASVVEILIGKLLPYFALGMLSTLGATALAVFVFDVPLRGSLAGFLLLSATFMVPALGQGLLISSITRNQFLAAQIALFSGFLPAFMLSGFLYEIDAMPAPIRAITWFIPARYFVSSLKTVFLAGDIWVVFVPNLLAMAAIGFLFFVLAKRATRKNLE